MEDDGDDKDDCKRRTRNLSEKKRRDQFNMLVNELSTMVGTNGRKMDKSTVLKSTISFLREHNEIAVRSRAHDVHVDWKPSFLSNEEFTFITLEGLEGFVMVFSDTGRIYYVSESITSLLGHNPADIVNKSIFDLSLEDDRPRLYSFLQSPRNAVDPMNPIKKDNQFWFQCQLRRGNLDFRDEVTYERVEINGHLSEGSTLERDMDDMNFQQENESRLLFVCTGRLQTPQLIRDVSLTDFERNEFTSRHSLEWKFLFLDHRAPPIIGYLPFEVLGTSGYDYYHFDDLEKVVMCHEALMEKGEMTSCYYRFLTKGQQWIWLQTRYYITYHQWNSKPEFVVCSHRVVSYVDITKSMKQETVEETPSDADMNSGALQEAPPEELAPISPTYAPGPAFVNYQPMSQPPSSASSTTGTVATTGTGATTGASWAQNSSHARYAGTVGSETASMSGDSREAVKVVEPALVPQHGIGAQYLDPAPYVSMPAVLPLPVLISHDQAQIQEQLQRKHEELQDMIVRQQEELRQVKEQLLLARLGLLQPLIEVPRSYLDPEVLPPRLPAEIMFEAQRLEQQSNYLPPPSPPPEEPHQAQFHQAQPHPPQPHQPQPHQPQFHQSQSQSHQPQPHQTQHHQQQHQQSQHHQPQPQQSQPPQPQSHQPPPHQTQPHQPQPHQPQFHKSQSQSQSHQPQPHQTQRHQSQHHQPQPQQSQPPQPQSHQPPPHQTQPHQTQPHQPQPHEPQPLQLQSHQLQPFQPPPHQIQPPQPKPHQPQPHPPQPHQPQPPQ